ncbi:MAG: DUF1287 domain-containing protein [Oscillospiraceae bacterium]|nr:DUF1287 domain-containing protein [Oscillospiraceae bacterium]
MKRKKTHRVLKVFASVFGGIILAVGIYFAVIFNILPEISFKAAFFDIDTVHSSVDFNNNGTDDYTDIMLGARKDAENHPRYDSSYWAEGYPPDDIGVCTDVVWRAFKNAGYNLREMVDKDIQLRPEAYTKITKRDSNIDFRRVVNLRVFFEEYGQKLTLDTNDIGQWQPGDIVIFGNDKHIGIVSDKRNIKGQTFIIHNGGQPNREEDYFKRGEVTGHYRFDASVVNKDILISWE